MAESADDRVEPAGLRFEARCAWCGPVAVGRDGLGMHVGSGRDALLEFVCPRCTHLNVRALRTADVATLALAGVHPVGGPAPFELLEERSGPPIAWDDLLDLHQDLAQMDWRWNELERAVAASGSDRMREAA